MANRTGRGVATWPDGTRFEGEWRDGQRHGKGVETWPDDTRFEVEYRDGHLLWKVVETKPDGTHSEGEYRDDKRHGEGSRRGRPARATRASIAMAIGEGRLLR